MYVFFFRTGLFRLKFRKKNYALIQIITILVPQIWTEKLAQGSKTKTMHSLTKVKYPRKKHD